MNETPLTAADVKRLSDVKFKVCIGLIIGLAALIIGLFSSVHSYTHKQTDYLNTRRVHSDAVFAVTADQLSTFRSAVCGLLNSGKGPVPPVIVRFEATQIKALDGNRVVKVPLCPPGGSR